MLIQVSAIVIPSTGTDTKQFEQFILEVAIPTAEQTVLTRITQGVSQTLLKGEDEKGRQTYYVWRGELDLMMGGSVAPTLIDSLFDTMRAQLATQNATLTSPLSLVLPKTD